MYFVKKKRIQLKERQLYQTCTNTQVLVSYMGNPSLLITTRYLTRNRTLSLQCILFLYPLFLNLLHSVG